jgi:hypothetical protein
MYKIDSLLTSVTTKSLELALRTAQPDGIVFFVCNTPLLIYMELARGQPAFNDVYCHFPR